MALHTAVAQVEVTFVDAIKTRVCSRWGAARYGAVLAVEYVRATTRRHQVLPSRESFRLDDAPWWACFGGGGFFANNAISRRDLNLWPFDLEIGPRGARVPGILPTKFGIRRPFRFPSRWRHGTDRRTDGRTDRQTDGQHRYIMGPSSRKDDPIITYTITKWCFLQTITFLLNCWDKRKGMVLKRLLRNFPANRGQCQD